MHLLYNVIGYSMYVVLYVRRSAFSYLSYKNFLFNFKLWPLVFCNKEKEKNLLISRSFEFWIMFKV